MSYRCDATLPDESTCSKVGYAVLENVLGKPCVCEDCFAWLKDNTAFTVGAVVIEYGSPGRIRPVGELGKVRPLKAL